MTSILYNQVVCMDKLNDFEVFHPSGSGNSKSDYLGSHNAFLWKYFDKAAEYKNDEANDDDAKYGKTNDEYRQLSEDEQFGKGDYYDQGHDNYGKTNDKYQHNPYGEEADDFDYQHARIKSSTHHQNQETKHDPKNCKIVWIGEMKCSVCKDSAGTHSKSCSVSSTPPKQKYEYTKQRLAAYNSEDDDNKKKHETVEEQPEEYWEGDEAASVL